MDDRTAVSGAPPPAGGLAEPARAGLSAAEVAARLARDGPNVLPRHRGTPAVLELARQMVHLFAVMLWVAAALAWWGGMPALATAIVVVVVLNGLFSFVQEHSADRATARLRDLMPVRARVRRDGAPQVVDAAELVVGDLVLLTSGDRVCADLAVLPGGALDLDESMVTGESGARRREPGDVVLAGTFVVAGAGDAVVVATGARTRIAGIATVMEHARRPRSPLTGALRGVTRVIAAIAVAVGGAAFALSWALGRPLDQSYLFAIGVTVALVPEGLLPTVTLSLSRAAQRMARRDALVRRLDAVETLGCTTYVCTDKTGTLTQNRMAVVRVWSPAGTVCLRGRGYEPRADVDGLPGAVDRARRAAASAARCVPEARAQRCGDDWTPVGDPMEVALKVLADRLGVAPRTRTGVLTPFDARRRTSSAADADGTHVLGAPDAVLGRCDPVDGADDALEELTSAGLRVLAVAWGPAPDGDAEPGRPDVGPLELLGLLALEDPPREDVAEAVARVRGAGIRLAMVTGDHPATALAVAREVGLVRGPPTVLTGDGLPDDEALLGAVLDRDDVVVARVTPEDKLRITRALQARGHVVAMTGDGVNDGPALRAADTGVAMGRSGSDVAREAADIVLLDDHFASVVAAVELGRATFANIRRFLTYHLTDNVAELTPFAVWALSGGQIPLALTVLQVLALDIGTDLLPALALGAEPPNRRTMQGRRHLGALVDRTVVRRAFGVLGPAEACAAMAGFLTVLLAGGWSPGEPAAPGLLASASGVCFSAIVLGQLANAFACRSESSAVGRVRAGHNPLLTVAVGVELLLLVVFLSVPPLPELLGGRLPDAGGWALAAIAVPAVLLVDAADKELRARRARRSRPTPRPPWAISPPQDLRPGHGPTPRSLP